MSRIPAILVPSFIKKSYRAKFIVSFLFVLIVIGSIGAYGYVDTNSTVEQDATESLQSSATLQAESLSEWSSGLESQTKSASSSVFNQDSTNQIQNSHRRDYLEQNSEIIAVHHFDAESNEMITSTDGDYNEEGLLLDEIDAVWTDSDVQETLMAQSIWRSDTAYFSSDTASVDSRLVSFAANEGTDPNKITVVEGRFDSRVQQLDQPGINHSTTIVNTEGESVLEDRDGEVSNVDQSAVRQSIDEATANGTVQFLNHGDTLQAFAPIKGTDWIAVTTVPADDAFVVRDAVGENVLFIIGAAVLSLGLVAVVLGRQTIIPLTRLRHQAEQMEEGNLEVNLETNRVDEIGQLFGAFDSMRHSLRDRIEEVEQARDEADRMNHHLEQKATEYSTVMQACADGDFTQRMDADSENEAMKEIALEFNEMVTEIEETTEELKEFATDVATASEQVTASTEEVRAASTQVADSVQAISSGAERQNESLQSVDHEMEGLSSTVEEIAASSNEVADIAARTAETGEDGREAADAAVEGMNQIETESQRAVEEIEALEAEITQIDELVEFISEVAGKTNMLALNANIEAARSSEAGDDGFGVVANEVKELAADTKEAADDIEELIDDIKSQTHRTAAEVQETSDQVATHRAAVENAAQSLDRVATYAQETNGGVQDISAATEQQAASTQEVVAMVDEAAAISEETSSEAENVAAAAEEQTSSLTEVSRAVAELSQQASRLSGELDQFDTDAIDRIEGSPMVNEADLELSSDELDNGADSVARVDDETAGENQVEDEFSFVEDDQTPDTEREESESADDDDDSPTVSSDGPTDT